MFQNAIFLHNFKQSISFNARVAVIVQTPYQSKEFCDLHQLIPMGKFFVSINYAYYEIRLNEEEAKMWNRMKLSYNYFPVTIDISYFIVCILMKKYNDCTKGLGLYESNEYPTRIINKGREHFWWVGIGKNCFWQDLKGLDWQTRRHNRSVFSCAECILMGFEHG